MTAQEARIITNKHIKSPVFFIKKIDKLIKTAAFNGEKYIVFTVEDEFKDEVLQEVKNYYETNGFRVYLDQSFILCPRLKIYW